MPAGFATTATVLAKFCDAKIHKINAGEQTSHYLFIKKRGTFRKGVPRFFIYGSNARIYFFSFIPSIIPL